MADAGEIPDHFLCPISLEIMYDPVTVSSGHTFDRPSIAAWLSAGNPTCPVTRSPISSDLIPNLTLRCLIHHHTSAAIPAAPKSPAATNPVILRYLLARSSPSSGLETPTRVAAVTRLSRLVRDSDETRSLLSSLPETRRVLESILFSSGSDELRNESLALLAAVRLGESGSNSVDSGSGTDTDRIRILIRLMSEPNTIDVRANAAAVMEAVLAGTASPEMIYDVAGDEGAVEAAVAVIKGGVFFRRAVKCGVRALFELCLARPNRARAAAAGSAEALVELVSELEEVERGDVERALATAELMCRTPEGRAAFAGCPGAAAVLVRMLLKVSERATEYAAGVLLAVCEASERARGEAVAAGVATRLLLVVESGCTAPRGKRKALMVLRLLDEAWPRDENDKLVWSDVVLC